MAQQLDVAVLCAALSLFSGSTAFVLSTKPFSVSEGVTDWEARFCTQACRSFA